MNWSVTRGFGQAFVILTLIWLAVACSTVPVTGRKQLIMTSQEQEAQLGLTAFEQMKKDVKISKDPQANALVEKVGKRIAAVAELPNAKWEFVVFDDPQANAFCLPGGKVGVYTGILPVTKDEAGLATVIGHEVAHAVARHGGERMTDSLLQQAGAEVASAIGNYYELSPQWQGAVNAAYGFGTQVGGMLPHSRLQESEADHLGLIYMARAGYDPNAAVAFWQRFAEFNSKSGSSTPAFLRTHPLDEKRIEQIKGWLPEAKAQYRPGL